MAIVTRSFARFSAAVVFAFFLAGLAGCSRRESAAHWQAGPAVGTLDLLGVCFIEKDTGWAVGGIDPKGSGGLIYQTNDGGKTWNAIAQTAEILTSVKFVNARTGWVAGYAGRIDRTDDGGRTWRAQRPERGSDIFNSLFFLNDHVGFAAGGSGLLLKTENGGNSWEPIPTGRVEDFWVIRFSSPDKGLIAGEDGLILATSDAGAHWQAVPSGTTVALMSLAISPKGHAVVVGQRGTVLTSSDWNHWLKVESGTDESLNAVACAGDSLFWAVGAKGTTIESADGGANWKPSPSGCSRDLLSIALADPSHGVAMGQRGCTQVLTTH